MVQCDALDGTPVGFNGDDALELVCEGAVVDSLGQVGFDPGTAWTGGIVSTRDQTLRRSCALRDGDSVSMDLFDPSVEWVSFPADTFGDLGVHCLR